MSAGFLRRRTPLLPRIGDVINGTLSASGLMGGGGSGYTDHHLGPMASGSTWRAGDDGDLGEGSPAEIRGILTEDGIPILTEDGSWIQAENQ